MHPECDCITENLYRDPLTGMPNLFGLMECDLEEVFGKDGILLFLDMKNLAAVNRKHGMALGDHCFRELADILSEQVFQKHPGVRCFRAGGDLFILRFPSTDATLAETIGMQADEELHRRMLKYGIQNFGIYFATWPYHSGIHSIAALMKQGNVSLFERIERTTIDPTLPYWAEHTIELLFDRVYDTLQLLKQNHVLAHRDDISGLPNHRAAVHRLQLAYERHVDEGRPYSVLFIDGDNLKRYNDLGYQHGNDMIRGLASILSKCLRDGDMVFRWLSGDEFLVLLENTLPGRTADIAERLRAAIEANTRIWKIPVTISIGIAVCPWDGDTPAELVAVAERRNSLAKQAGKNQVVQEDPR